MDSPAIDYLFEDLLIVDAATFLAGPGAATVFGDYGARVVKIEPPGGDRYRTLKGTWKIDYNWLLTSRNKESLGLDVSRPEGRKIIHDLVKHADVFITNFIGEQLNRYEYEYERIAELNPRIVYAHISGYGTKGPHVAKRGFDASAWWARSGMMDFVREQDVIPSTSPPGMGDHATAMSLFSAIVAALYRREKTGKGGYVSTSLLANGIWSNGMLLQGVLSGTDVALRRHTHGVNNPFSRVYETRDGHYILFTVINADREWPQLARALGQPHWLDDDRFVDLRTLIQNRHALIEMIEECVRSMDVEDAVQRLDEYGITHSWVKPNGLVVDDEQVMANEMIVDTGEVSEDYQRTIMSPIHIDNEQKRRPRRAPDVGANSRSVLKSILQRTDNDIQQLIDEGVVVEPEAGSS